MFSKKKFPKLKINCKIKKKEFHDVECNRYYRIFSFSLRSRIRNVSSHMQSGKIRKTFFKKLFWPLLIGGFILLLTGASLAEPDASAVKAEEKYSTLDTAYQKLTKEHQALEKNMKASVPRPKRRNPKLKLATKKNSANSAKR